MKSPRWLFAAQALGWLLAGCGGILEADQDPQSETPEVTRLEDPYAAQSEGGASAQAIANCEATTLQGQLEGVALDRHYPYQVGSEWSSLSTDESRSLSTPLGATGQASMSWVGDWGTGVSLDDGAPPEVFDATQASLRLPLGLMPDDGYLCVTGQSSIEVESNYYLRTYRGVALLPGCASGTPVQGSLDVCMGSDTDCPEKISGTIGDVAYDGQTIGLGLNNWVLTSDLTSALDLRVGMGQAENGVAQVFFSWIRSPSTGDIYCGGGTSSATLTTSWPASGAGLQPSIRKIEVELRDLRRVGNCAEVKGTDTLEVRSCIE